MEKFKRGSIHSGHSRGNCTRNSAKLAFSISLLAVHAIREACSLISSGEMDSHRLILAGSDIDRPQIDPRLFTRNLASMITSMNRHRSRIHMKCNTHNCIDS